MSKMSQLNLAVTEEAYDMGYISLEAALADGWEIDYERGKLYKGVNALELAHREWLREKEEVLGELTSVYNDIDVPKDLKKYIKHAIEFIKKGEI